MGLISKLHGRFHEARADLFVRVVRPWPGARMLDLGGSDGSLSARIAARVPLDVTVADVSTHHAHVLEALGFHSVTLDGSGSLPFEAGMFDIVLCNSVIEHVTLPKERCAVDQRVDQDEWVRESERAQRAFAAELRRVAGAYFVQTPHRHFPVDPHVLLPMVQYLSHNAACRLVEWTDRFWAKSCWGIVDWHLLSTRDMRTLFPGAHIHVERFAGLPKSVIAYRPAQP